MYIVYNHISAGREWINEIAIGKRSKNGFITGNKLKSKNFTQFEKCRRKLTLATREIYLFFLIKLTWHCCIH